MLHAPIIWPDAVTFLAAEAPEEPVFIFAPAALKAQARRFLDGFPGLTTYAVKANAHPQVLATLLEAGVRAFDVASPDEIETVLSLAPDARLHYHNPVKSRAELAFAHRRGVRVFACDSAAELAKMREVLPPEGVQISVRFRMPAKGAAYDFGAKFGAEPEAAARLLAEAAAAGFAPALTFHPGTQCLNPDAWRIYIEAAARIARMAGVRLAQLNVGGGFPARRTGDEAFALEDYFAAIAEAARRAFGDQVPPLACEPGRAMAADCMSVATRVKLVREDGAVFLNDGIYGALAEAPLLGSATRMRVLDPSGRPRRGAPRPRVVFGPTCDSVDRLPGEPALPDDLAEGDFVLFEGLGAYGMATVTRFNGYGPTRVATVSAPRPV
ncbi:ornithine decarboxylase [Oceanicella actignis]|uniref:ornithine decarboxylase n=1 Tax=Oceanicella actignis TaxID=1189325 RepID=A0A1M7SCJ9_9RHOB|nr:ornithine decarboxylase [Oceanicella actignis]TYO91470.1 ornithine decarboxylase [Oceanicella actignis]SET26067.1 ornithine decarboxylase [Oceanicella actignis]SHN56237.1 ornithine decarboxylase [Oceanicella actignis]